MGTAANTLPVSRLINVTATLSPTAQQAESLSTFLVLGSSPVIDPLTRLRTYETLQAVGVDFGINAPEYLGAAAWFSQAPTPASLDIGRWLQTASSAQLLGGALSALQQALGNFTSITNGEIDVTVDGVVKALVGLNFTTCANLNAVAGVVQAALTGATIVWDPVYSRFEVTSATTGAGSTISFATPGVGGTNMAPLLGLTSTTSGAYLAQGQIAESALACVALFDVQFGQQFYGFAVLGAADADVQAIQAYVQAATNYHYYFPTTQEAASLTPGETTSLAYKLSQVAGATYTALQYSSSSPYACISLAARILTTDYTANNSTIDLFYKQEPGIVAENLNASQATTLEGKNCNFFADYNNGTAIIEPGVSCAGAPYYIDTVIGVVSLVLSIQTAVYNLLYGSATKVPQTDAGMHQIQTTIQKVCQQYVDNGLLAPGTWTSQGFGSLNFGDFMPTGYYVYAPSIATQSAANRAKRLSVPFQVAVKLAGAVNYVNVSVLVNN